MWQYNHTDDLKHFGVRGMRWGHRSGPGSDISSHIERKTQEKKELKETWKLRSKVIGSKKQIHKEASTNLKNYKSDVKKGVRKADKDELSLLKYKKIDAMDRLQSVKQANPRRLNEIVQTDMKFSKMRLANTLGNDHLIAITKKYKDLVPEDPAQSSLVDKYYKEYDDAFNMYLQKADKIWKAKDLYS